jgi:hypothetical protein
MHNTVGRSENLHRVIRRIRRNVYPAMTSRIRG